uniref:Putative secreted protein n=1 Tax=Anopheles darlingi TaxID=43151 RepID=A0A2M4DMH8_ANODA
MMWRLHRWTLRLCCRITRSSRCRYANRRMRSWCGSSWYSARTSHRTPSSTSICSKLWSITSSANYSHMKSPISCTSRTIAPPRVRVFA